MTISRARSLKCNRMTDSANWKSSTRFLRQIVRYFNEHCQSEQRLRRTNIFPSGILCVTLMYVISIFRYLLGNNGSAEFLIIAMNRKNYYLCLWFNYTSDWTILAKSMKHCYYYNLLFLWYLSISLTKYWTILIKNIFSLYFNNIIFFLTQK